MSRSQYGLGYHRGQSDMLAKIIAAQVDTLAQVKAQQRAANRDVLAGAIGSFLAQMIPATAKVIKEHRREQRAECIDTAP